MTNAEGEVVWSARYKAYGNLALQDVEDVQNPLRFQGQYYDEETGLHYNRRRYYDPSAARFINQDPVGLLGGDNNYQYAPNPTGWVDPYGLTCKENSWNQFQKDTKGHFANSTEAAKSYQKMKEVEGMPRGSKPDDPASYLPQSYIDSYKQKFASEGGAFIVVESWTIGSRHSTLPPRKFVGLKSEMDQVIQKFESTGDLNVLNDELNLGLSDMDLKGLEKDRIMYVQIKPGDSRFSYEMPTGNEFGAIPGEWVPGGKTKSGTTEAALIGAEKVDHGKSLDGYEKAFENARIIKDK
ncbi:Rhs family protein [Hahella chejuensis KCTC 2396]|uniref:Rhs family protein n=1 Tax=Hahella chejuensis (strain KCTC 2396) TaxID=349521 RepID=Q2SFS1_HAHCH|nr:RHS repeat-associated core domain-containing protein [Hahella chejuensis]ABC30503.1 Rhs family protein [Hahella chejuensis KCTC 2396]